MNRRIDTVLAELGASYGDNPAFVDHLRHHVEQLLDPRTPQESHPELLERLARSCARHVALTRGGGRTRRALDRSKSATAPE